MRRSLSQQFGWDTTAFRTDHHVIISEYLLVFSALLAISLLLQHYWTKCWRCTLIPEAGMTIMLGMTVSFIIYCSGGYDSLHQQYNADNNSGNSISNTDDENAGISSGLQILSFSPTIFFFGFLPPIIYNSGYHLKRASFYGNIGAILLLAVGGTCISTMTIATGMYYAPRLFNDVLSGGFNNGNSGSGDGSGAAADISANMNIRMSTNRQIDVVGDTNKNVVSETSFQYLPAKSLRGNNDKYHNKWISPPSEYLQTTTTSSNNGPAFNLGDMHDGEPELTHKNLRTKYTPFASHNDPSDSSPTAQISTVSITSSSSAMLTSLFTPTSFASTIAITTNTEPQTSNNTATMTSSVTEQPRQVVPVFTFMECVAYGALISSTDPVSTLAIYTEHRVDPALFYLVFGESVLNDAIAITIFKVASSFIGTGSMEALDIVTFAGKFCILFLSSCLIGYGLGIFSAYLFKVLTHLHNDDLAVLGLFCSTVYIPFLLAETLQLSGIVTILFTGIASRRYTSKNVNPSLRMTISKLFHLLAYASDTSCFLLLGLITFNLPFASYNWTLIGWLTMLCLVSRCIFVYPLLSLANLFRRCSRESAGTDMDSLPSANLGGLEMVSCHSPNTHCDNRIDDATCHEATNQVTNRGNHPLFRSRAADVAPHSNSYISSSSSSSSSDSSPRSDSCSQIELLEPNTSDLRDYYDQFPSEPATVPVVSAPASTNTSCPSQSNDDADRGSCTGNSGRSKGSEQKTVTTANTDTLLLRTPSDTVMIDTAAAAHRPNSAHAAIKSTVSFIPTAAAGGTNIFVQQPLARPTIPPMDVIPNNIKHMVAFSGLRGGVAFAFAMMFSDAYGNRSVLLTSTISIIMITIFIQGGLTVHMLSYLGIRTGMKKKQNRSQRVESNTSSVNVNAGRKDGTNYVGGNEGITLQHNIMSDFEQKYIYPLVLAQYADYSAVTTCTDGILYTNDDNNNINGCDTILPSHMPADRKGESEGEGEGDIYSPYYRSSVYPHSLKAGYTNIDTNDTKINSTSSIMNSNTNPSNGISSSVNTGISTSSSPSVPLQLLVDTETVPDGLACTALHSQALLSPLHPLHLHHQAQLLLSTQCAQGQGNHCQQQPVSLSQLAPLSHVCLRGRTHRMFHEEPCSSGGGSYHDPECASEEEGDALLVHSQGNGIDTDWTGTDNRLSRFFSPQQASKYNGFVQHKET